MEKRREGEGEGEGEGDDKGKVRKEYKFETYKFDKENILRIEAEHKVTKEVYVLDLAFESISQLTRHTVDDPDSFIAFFSDALASKVEAVQLEVQRISGMLILTFEVKSL